jgi:hypothetical protein
VQRRFRVQPRVETVALQFLREIAGDALVRCAIDSESQTNAVLIERARDDLKMPDEKDRDCQYDVKYGGN